MTSLRQIILEETVNSRKANPNIEVSLRNSLKNEGIIDEAKIDRILANIDITIADEVIKQSGDRFLALVPNLAGIEAQEICEEILTSVRGIGVEAANEIIAELSPPT